MPSTRFLRSAGWSAYFSAASVIISVVLTIIVFSLGLVTLGARSHSAFVEMFGVLAALFALPLPFVLYYLYRGASPTLSLIAAVIGVAVALGGAILHLLFVFEILWFAEVISVFLYGLLGFSLWMLLNAYLAYKSRKPPHGLVMSLVGATVIGYPIWAVWLGRLILSGRLFTTKRRYPMKETVREAPFPIPFQCGLDDESHPHVKKEPVLAVDQIQGNILAGFTKDFQALVFLQIDEAEDFKPWLASQVDFIATTAEVLAFNRLFKEIRSRRGTDASAVKATWLNIAFSFEGIKALVGAAEADKFNDQAFKDGLAARSERLGDPRNTDDVEGSPKNWVVGGPTCDPVHVVLIVASDDRGDMLAEVERLEESLRDFRREDGTRAPCGAHVVFKEEGTNLPPPLSGHEHFGFLDGVSQPGVRGRISDDPHDVLTLRQNPRDRDQGKPGQDLLWPGEFVFGYAGQDPNKEVGEAGDVMEAGPEWARDGSFLVFRRLRQDVFGFHKFMKGVAAHFKVMDTKFSSGSRMIGSSLVGRWPSGAPVERVPDDDNRKLANDDCANNHFEFQDAVETIAGSDQESDFDCRDDQFPAPVEDQEGDRLPFTGHIRKAYPRDDTSDNPTEDLAADPSCRRARADLKESSTQTHRILRRGIPFGPVSPSTPEAPFDDGVSRGLHFLAYQTSIEEQFEFISKCWVNNKDFKEPFGHSPLAGGHDPIIGQNNAPGEDREREFTIAFTEGSSHRRNERVKTKDFTDAGRRDWVIPTGGGYFFAPSIDVLKGKLSK